MASCPVRAFVCTRVHVLVPVRLVVVGVGGIEVAET